MESQPLIDTGKIKYAYHLLVTHPLPIAGVMLSMALLSVAMMFLSVMLLPFSVVLYIVLLLVGMVALGAVQTGAVAQVLYDITVEGEGRIGLALSRGVERFTAVFIGMLLTMFHVFIGFLMLIIPGIIRIFQYAFIPYLIFFDNLAFDRAKTLSIRMTDGRKLAIFLTSFIAVLPVAFLSAIINQIEAIPMLLKELVSAMVAWPGAIVLFLFFKEARDQFDHRMNE